MSLLRRTFIIAVLFIASSLCNPAFSYPEIKASELRIGIIPEQNIFRQNQKYNALAHYINSKTGIKVSILVLSDYGSVINTMLSGGIDGAFFGSLSGAVAHERLGAEALVRSISIGGKTTYHGHIFVRKDSRINNAADMKGKSMVFIDKGSSCGYIYPLAYLGRHGITNISTFFSEHYFAGSHDAAIIAVLNGRVDVGVAKSTVYSSLQAANPRIEKELKIIDESPEFPSHGLFLGKSVPPDIRSAVRKTLLEMHGDTEGRAILKNLDITGYAAADVHEDYKNVFELAKKAGINLKTYNLKKK
ncbi:MAG: phosphate/phosphite/phosphonate ABC transporter substrate-binding protein [Nitrospirae bacterium]|nr:MAG: phosphate/phosphite/phosphonate ABC transporter substrate-binding protein [Nitrospirota bacterium]